LVRIYADHREALKDEQSLKEYIALLRAERTELETVYKNYLRVGLGRLQDWLGPPFGAKALMFNTGLAVLYSMLLFSFSWVLGGSGRIGALRILPETLDVPMRFAAALSLGLSYVAILKHEKIDAWFEERIERILPRPKPSLIYRLLAIAIMAVAALILKWPQVVILIFLAIVSPSFAVAVAGAGAFAFAVAFAVAVAGAVAGAFAFAFAGAVAVAYKKERFGLAYVFSLLPVAGLFAALYARVGFVKLHPDVVSVLLFIVILPYINGLMDFISLWISRLLGRDILNRSGIGVFLTHIAFDLVAAVMLLCLLALGICFLVETFNLFIVRNSIMTINISELIRNAMQVPFSARGLWITLMLFSTLLPTFIHVIVALAGFYTVRTPQWMRERIAATLEDKPSVRRLFWPAIYFAAKWPLSFAFALMFFVGAGYLGSANLVHFGRFIADVAYIGIGWADALYIMS
jgi:hypothetical protein